MINSFNPEIIGNHNSGKTTIVTMFWTSEKYDYFYIRRISGKKTEIFSDLESLIIILYWQRKNFNVGLILRLFGDPFKSGLSIFHILNKNRNTWNDTLDTKSFKDQNTCITLAAKITIVSFSLGKNVATILILATIAVFIRFRNFFIILSRNYSFSTNSCIFVGSNTWPLLGFLLRFWL